MWGRERKRKGQPDKISTSATWRPEFGELQIKEIADIRPGVKVVECYMDEHGNKVRGRTYEIVGRPYEREVCRGKGMWARVKFTTMQGDKTFTEFSLADHSVVSYGKTQTSWNQNNWLERVEKPS